MERGLASSHKGDEESLIVRVGRGRSLLQSVPSFENSPQDCFQNSPLAERLRFRGFRPLLCISDQPRSQARWLPAYADGDGGTAPRPCKLF